MILMWYSTHLKWSFLGIFFYYYSWCIRVVTARVIKIHSKGVNGIISGIFLMPIIDFIVA